MKKSLGYLIRLKKDRAFSLSLNAYIEAKYKSLSKDLNVEFVENDPYFDQGDSLESSAEKMFEDFANGRLKIWTGASENTIFGSPEINHKFRFIHDFYHCQNKLGFTHGDELLVNYIQQREFRKDGPSGFDRQLLNIETAGQILYYIQNGDFPTDQRKFTINELQLMGY